MLNKKFVTKSYIGLNPCYSGNCIECFLPITTTTGVKAVLILVIVEIVLSAGNAAIMKWNNFKVLILVIVEIVLSENIYHLTNS